MSGWLQRRRWVLTGIVQGVGFRPHVARVAARFVPGLTGFCGNDALSVFIEAQGSSQDLQAFIAAVLKETPPLSHVLSCKETVIDVVDGETGFKIVPSQGGAGARTLIPPDVSLCQDCLADMRNPHNRRFGYAFTTCTNCGPRLSIILDLPYDRPQTTMRDFPLCAACAAEYRDPTNRRFHAQPISCFDCGPHIWSVSAGELPDGLNDPFGCTRPPSDMIDGSRGGRSRTEQDAVLDSAARLIRAGKIVAVKGLGGFHLLVDATNESAVRRLRQRKRRDGKPLAVMVLDMAQARELVDRDFLDGAAQALLQSSAHPIVLLPRVASYPDGSATIPVVADSVAPGVDTLGVMLPYTPLHLLLLEKIGRPVVATSGNLSGEPLCYTNSDALMRLSRVADAFVLHNRGIVTPVEDSVVMVASPLPQFEDTGGSAPGVSLSLVPECDLVTPVRRSRGYVPVPLSLQTGEFAHGGETTSLQRDNQVNPVILGVGGEIKNTFTLIREGMAFTSAHMGDMSSLASQRAYQDAIDQLNLIHREEPAVVVCDKHPNYATTAWAQRYVASAGEQGREVKLFTLQHHRAHVFSLMAETGASRAVVMSLDGTGYGDDGKIWGSEVFIVDVVDVIRDRVQLNSQGMKRWAHLPYFPLPGADLAVREPWRQAAALLRTLGVEARGLPLVSWFNSPAGKVLFSQVDSGSTPLSCALGRYFDAAAAVLDLCPLSSYEAAAPVALQTAAQRWVASNPQAARTLLKQVGQDDLSDLTRENNTANNARELPIRELFATLVSGMRAGQEPGKLAFYFHAAVANLFAAVTLSACRYQQCTTAGITGGCALNPLLTGLISRQIKAHELTWLTHSRIPANDGGLSLGQAFYGYLRSIRQ